jgi:hypothetical protein
MSKKICKSNAGWEDVAHFCIIKFTEHERAEELIGLGQAMKFLSGMIYRSFWSNTSQYYTLYHQKGKFSPVSTIYDEAMPEAQEYDYEEDLTIEAILGIIEDMKHTEGEGGNRDKKLWEIATYLEQWVQTPNYSELSRISKIPRTTISHGVEEAIQYIRQQLKQNNINYGDN